MTENESSLHSEFKLLFGFDRYMSGLVNIFGWQGNGQRSTSEALRSCITVDVQANELVTQSQ